MTHDETPREGGVRPPADFNPRSQPPLDFPDRDLEEMTPADYEILGFLAGLEVHQQLDTRGKLFCRCPAGRKARRVDAEVLRHMRPTLSELGEYDGTALMEFKTRKEIIYRLERSCVCTYEMDDTPPFEIDKQAVKIALEVCRLLELDLVSELHVMRKQYLDGSIPTGFQRTAMVGLGGAIPFRESQLGSDRVLRIRQLSLEEDSCREVSDIGHRIIFVTDRLGMPLIETVTEPDMLTPFDVQAGGRLLAAVARATGKVRRGPGAARQDVNVSIAGSRRIEIKGVDNHRGLPRLVHIEAFRQLNLLRLREALRQRGVQEEFFAIAPRGPAWEVSDLVIDARSLLRDCEFAPVRHAFEQEQMLAAVRLRGFDGLLRHRTQPGINFARELRGRARVIACLTGEPFMIHSDVEDFGLSTLHWKQLRSALRADREDGLVVLWGPAEDVSTAAREILARAAEALVGVPAETRQSYPDGTTDFERILPGPDRMYPDTDTPPVPIPDPWVEELELCRNETPWEREDRYLADGLPAPLARRLGRAPWATLYDTLAPRTAEAARRLAWGLEKRLVHFWRESGRRVLPSAERLAPLVRALEEQRLHPDGFEPALDRLLREASWSPEDLLHAYLAGGETDDLDSLVAEAAEQARTLGTHLPEARLRWAMGRVMRGGRGRLDPVRVRAALARALDIKEAS
ncbi:MAG: Glu-tRNA(Gln) amidotransferase subunit GatE [Acidobacteriota bacterium]|nr:Glu-tRNA(Gln) amidotransferase subunit GatE [Acidobacteriota bacterium]MDQ7087715.1 Glu-tRNA(Gln) amidotransferase subunit GatE [Acidobacteriota bacterium]